jgi:hypothetical protein
LYLTNGIHLRTQTFFVPDGVNLEGESQELTILQASGGMGASGDGLNFTSNTILKHITLDSFATCVYVGAEQIVTFTNVTIKNCRNNGLIVDATAKVTANDSRFIQNEADSIRVNGDAQFTMIGGESSANGWTGLWMTGNNTKVSLDNVKITNNNTINSVGLGPAGIQISASGIDSSIKVRNSTISGNRHHGIIIDGFPHTVDFGTASDSGNNKILDNRTNDNTTYWEVFDSRFNVSSSIIELIGTTLQNNSALSGLKTCDGTPTNCQYANAGINYWGIMTSGNSLRLGNP